MRRSVREVQIPQRDVVVREHHPVAGNVQVEAILQERPVVQLGVEEVLAVRDDSAGLRPCFAARVGEVDGQPAVRLVASSLPQEKSVVTDRAPIQFVRGMEDIARALQLCKKNSLVPKLWSEATSLCLA